MLGGYHSKSGRFGAKKKICFLGPNHSLNTVMNENKIEGHKH
jgi:hypothetical protein